MSGNAIERRRAPRASADLPIRLGENEQTLPARLRDLSSSGLCCHYPEPLREMTMVQMDLDLPGQEGSHQVQGAVVRCEKQRGINPPTYEVAVFFTDLAPGARKAIDGFVRSRIEASV